ncbi:MAG: endopeptidase La [Candidatus Wallbacteria bacterium]|nr:endopeptidase La [Candidatus Wallbacteria bacterium]
MEEQEKEEQMLPFLPLRDVVVFPYMIVPLFVGRESSIKSIEKSMSEGRTILLVTQKNPRVEEPKVTDIYEVGTVAEILQMLKLPDGTYKILVEGLYRGKVMEFSMIPELFSARVKKIEANPESNVEISALMRNVINQFESYIRLNKRVPLEIMMVINNTEDPGRLCDIVTAHLLVNVTRKQEILEALDARERLQKLAMILSNEIEILNVEKRIRSRVRQQLDKVQKEYYLREQLKAIRKELGDADDGESDHDEFKKRLKDSKLPDYARERVEEELKKMSRMQSDSAEHTVSRNYVDWILSLPWSKKSKDTESLQESIKVLENDHYGLEKIKERIVEYLAVRKLTKKLKGPILCFVGPPGVGKTSLGQSIARALGREFVRFSLGGIRDEAEIRGHRRTYIGAQPGKIIQLLKQAKTKNPVILLDEVDKMSSDFRGDPSSALLEVLDPEQNNSFTDNYLSISFDLSDVMFITTANVTTSIPAPLYDRMEVLRISGYTELEKMSIARKYLVGKQLKAHGLSAKKCRIEDDALLSIIRNYTREAGVRSLERSIQSICRKIAKMMVNQEYKKFPVSADKKDLHKYLGVARYLDEKGYEKDEIGVVNGLAWTEVGGVILPIEVLITPGKGRLQLTGQLGDVMKESAQAALTYVRSISPRWKLKRDYFEKNDVHIHVPDGAIPKDGPSAGVAMATALASAIQRTKVRHYIGMTGEITLRGKVLPIGGLKEKLLAAYQAKLTEVMIPRENEKDMEEVPELILKKIRIHFVDSIDQVLESALVNSNTSSLTSKTVKKRFL